MRKGRKYEGICVKNNEAKRFEIDLKNSIAYVKIGEDYFLFPSWLLLTENLLEQIGIKILDIREIRK